MNERGFDVTADGRVHSRPDANAVTHLANTRSAPGARVTPEQFDKQEQARLEAAWERPDLQAELHGKRDAKGRFLATKAAAEAARPAAEEAGDPYWNYIAGHS